MTYSMIWTSRNNLLRDFQRALLFYIHPALLNSPVNIPIRLLVDSREVSPVLVLVPLLILGCESLLVVLDLSAPVS